MVLVVLGLRELEDASVKVEGAVVIVLHAYSPRASTSVIVCKRTASTSHHAEQQQGPSASVGTECVSMRVCVCYIPVESVTPGKFALSPIPAAALASAPPSAPPLPAAAAVVVVAVVAVAVVLPPGMNGVRRWKHPSR